MKKVVIFAGLFFCSLVSVHVHGQSINNKDWKSFMADPINDTLVFHIHSDSSYVTNSKGETILRTNCIISGDTLTLSDYQTSEHACPDMGKYKINLKGKSFTLSVINDPCEGRSQALDGVSWAESAKK